MFQLFGKCLFHSEHHFAPWFHSLTSLVFDIRHAFIGILFGSVYFQLGTSNDSTNYFNRLVLLYFTVFVGYLPNLDFLAEQFIYRNIFYRERASRAYSTLAYWLGRFIIAMPMNFIGCFLYSIIIYYMCGLRDANSNGGGSYFLYLVTNVILADNVGRIYISIISNISSSLYVAVSLFPPFAILQIFFEGYLIFLPTYPSWISWIADFVYMRFAYQGLVLNEFSGNTELELSSHYIHQLGFQSLDKGSALIIVIIIGIAMAYISYLCLYYFRFVKR